MSSPLIESDPHRPVANLLAEYLLGLPASSLPGADGLRIADVLAGYEALAAAGRVPTEADLCDRHPHLAARLVAYFYALHPVDEG